MGVPRPGDGARELPLRKPALGTHPTLAARPGAGAAERSPSAHSRAPLCREGLSPRERSLIGISACWRRKAGPLGTVAEMAETLAQGLSSLQQSAAGETRQGQSQAEPEKQHADTHRQFTEKCRDPRDMQRQWRCADTPHGARQMPETRRHTETVDRQAETPHTQAETPEICRDSI